MTSKEAIDLLDNLIGMVEDNQGNDYDGALKMAIGALTPKSDLISRQKLIESLQERYKLYDWDDGGAEKAECGAIIREIFDFPSAEPLTDIEQRIFLKAISREEEVCKKVDAEWGKGDEECEINLVHTCHEIERKVKGALWT